MTNFCWLALYYTSLLGLICVVLSAFFVSSSPTTKINPSEQGSNKNHWKGFIIATVIQAKFFSSKKQGPPMHSTTSWNPYWRNIFIFIHMYFIFFITCQQPILNLKLPICFTVFSFFIFYEVEFFFRKI